MEESIRKNPWIGLESYKEGDILYGRDDDIRDLSQCVLNDTDTLLYGKSGIGKSSIINAGILPAARRNGYLPVLIRLSHKEKESYLYQINRSIINAILDSCCRDLNVEIVSEIDFSELIKEVVPQNNFGSESLFEYFHRHTFHNVNGDRIKLLIIFDQFEEIFTLQESAQKRRDFFSGFADVLNNIMPDELQQKVNISFDSQKDVCIVQDENLENILDGLNLEVENNIPDYVTDNEIHFVFTIREDFLSEFEYYSAAIPSLKQNRYGLRLINEEQAAQIILQPVPGLIDKPVAKLIIEKITGRKDFKLDGIPEIEVDSAVLSLYLNRLYEAKGGDPITENLVEQKGVEIISDFYKEAISGISDSSVEYLEDMLLNGQERRDNITVYDAIYDGNVSEYELDVLCDKKKVLRRFNYSGDLRIEYVHDILCPIVAKNKSERQERKEKERQNERLKKLRKQRSITLSCIILLLGCIACYIIGYIIPVSDRFANTTKEWGNFVGIEPLSKEEASYRMYHFVLKKQGLFSQTYSSMECRDRFNNLCTDHGMSPYLASSSASDSLAADFKYKYQTVCQWKLIKDPIDKKSVIQERGYDKDDNLVYAFNYNSLQKRKDAGNFKNYLKKTRICTYVDEQGLPVELLKSGYKFVRITYDDKGRDMLVEYFDWDGNPSPNADGAYQTYYEYDDAGRIISMSSLNKYGWRMIDNAGNCGQICKYDGDRLVEILLVDEFGREKAVHNGYSRATFEYDDKGRETKFSFWNKNEPVCDDLLGFHLRETSYDDAKKSITYHLYNSEGERIKSIEVRFDKNGNLLYYEENTNEETTIAEMRFENNKLVCQNEIQIEGIDTIGVFNYEKKDKVETRKYTGKIDEEYIWRTTYDESDRIVEEIYFELDGQTPYERDGLHKIAYFYTDNGYRKKSLYYIKMDSTVYYHRDGIQSIQVVESAPNRNYVKEKKYNGDSFYSYSEKLLDVYENEIEEYRRNAKIYYFVNVKTKKKTGEFVWLLSRYKFPLPYCRLHYKDADGEWKDNICDENGNVDVPADYILPEMFSGELENTAVFIECTEQGRVWHGVILASQHGVCYGDENYSYDHFSGRDELLCLNLTSMRVVKLVPDTLDYWTIYTGEITGPQDALYKEFYIKATERGH